MITDSKSNDVTNKAGVWGGAERKIWLEKQTIQRSYFDDVITRIQSLDESIDVKKYGALSIDKIKYPLYIATTPNWNSNKLSIFITGGVHGYETSGVHGALRFLEEQALSYNEYFNFVVAPCVSPWGYETINRWNPQAVDPNRSFRTNGPSEEANFLMAKISDLGFDITAHFDLHETTDTDNTEFRPALASRDGVELKEWSIPDGFYSVGDINNPVDDFQTAIINSVKKVTHIAPADSEGNIIGEPITQDGVINYATKELGLCAGFSNAQFVTTTEVYPDSPNATDEICIQAQVAAVVGGVGYLKSKI